MRLSSPRIALVGCATLALVMASCTSKPPSSQQATPGPGVGEIVPFTPIPTFTPAPTFTPLPVPGT